MLDASAPQPPDELNALPAGTRFGELEILRTLGVGGFGIVYLAQDHSLERLVAVKEYMPGQLAQRGQSSQVSVRSSSLVETFEIGRRSFVNEARLLARFDHRSLLKVYRFWEANGTAYMVMPYLEGKTLRQTREAMSERPSEAWLLRVITPILDGLALLHAEQVYHRDIAPDNVLLPPGDAAPILLDFGAARRAIGDRTQSFTAILKPSYAPIEQYAESNSLRQGPWTDVYALGAMLHYLIRGHTPPPATLRAVSDEYEPLARQDLPGFSTPFLAAIDWALAVRPQHRPQSVSELRAALHGELQAPMPVASPAPVSAPADWAEDPDRTVVRPRTVTQPAPPTVAAVPAPAPLPKPAPVPAPAPSSAKPLVLIGALAVVVLAGGGAWWAMKSPANVAAQAQPQSDATQPAASSALAPAPVTLAPAPAPGPVVAEPRIATVSLPPAPSPSSTAARLPKPAPNPQGSRPPNPAPVNQEVAAASPPPPQRVPEVTAPVTAIAVAPAPASRPAPTNQDPRAACGKRVWLAMSRCIEQQCTKPEFTGHKECADLREIKARNERNEQRS